MTPSGLTHRPSGGKGGEAEGQIGVGPGQPAGSRKGVPFRRVRGIVSNLDDLTLRGHRWKAALGDDMLGGTLTRKIVGASELKITVLDRQRRLLRSDLLTEKHEVALDHMPFRFVACEDEGLNEPLTLTYEPRVVAKLREITGPHKAFRDKVTRAEFAKRLAFMIKPHPVFICPQLHKIQPIATPKQSREASEDAAERRGKGITEHVTLTVKGVKADAAQLAAGDRALRVAESEGANSRVMAALMAGLIVESLLGQLSDNWLEIIPSTASGGGIDPRNLEQSVRGFLRGYYSGAPGAIAYDKAHPDAKIYEITQGVQNSGAGEATNGAGNYGPWVDEAREWVEAFGGGTEKIATSTERYAFKQGRDESNWTKMVSLASDVHWRCFESVGWLYFIADPDLFRSMIRMIVSDTAPGIVDTSFKYDTGKPVSEVRVTARAKSWSAPPGTVVDVGRHGPADGLYIVERIDSPLAKRDSLCEITLRRPTKPLKEPAPQRSTRVIGGATEGSGGSSGMGIFEGTPEDIVNQVVDYAHANGFPNVTRTSVREANASHGPTISGGISDHQGPPSVRWAADISNGVTTPEETHLAAAIAKAFGIPWSGSGLVTHEAHGYRLQLIYKTMEGGNHYDHVHFGCAVA